MKEENNNSLALFDGINSPGQNWWMLYYKNNKRDFLFALKQNSMIILT